MIALNRQRLWLCLVPVLLLAAVLAARDLNKHAFWVDEINTLRDARGFEAEPRSPAGIWREVSRDNPDHAPGFFLLLNVWGRLTSWQPQTLRFFSLLIGLLSIAVTYRLGRRWLSAEVGLAAAVVMAVSPFYLYYFTQARVYLLACLLSITTLSIYLELVHRGRPPSRWLWLALFLSVAATVYSHYLASVTLIGIGVYHLLAVRRDRRWWTVVGVSVAGALLFVPWLWVLARSISRTSGNDGLQETVLSAPEVIGSFVWMFSNGVVVLMLALLAVAASTLRGAGRLARHARSIAIIAGVAFAAILIANALIGLIAPPRLRYLMPLWPLFALLVGLSMAGLRRPRGLMAGALALWIAGGLWSTLAVDFTAQLGGADYHVPLDRIAETLSPRVEPNDLILNYVPDDMWAPALKANALEYYYHILAHMPVGYSLADRRTTPESQAGLDDRMQKTFKGKRRIWVVYTPDHGTAGLPRILELLAQGGFHDCAFRPDDPTLGINLYVAPGVSCPALSTSE